MKIWKRWWKKWEIFLSFYNLFSFSSTIYHLLSSTIISSHLILSFPSHNPPSHQLPSHLISLPLTRSEFIGRRGGTYFDVRWDVDCEMRWKMRWLKMVGWNVLKNWQISSTISSTTISINQLTNTHQCLRCEKIVEHYLFFLIWMMMWLLNWTPKKGGRWWEDVRWW